MSEITKITIPASKTETALKTAKRSAKAAPESSANGERRSSNWRVDGRLINRQVAVLAALEKAGRPLPFSKIVHALRVDEKNAKTVRWAIGALRSKVPDARSLLNRKYVRATSVDVDGKTDHVYNITALGESALRKALAKTK
jgi:hypothetical protein